MGDIQALADSIKAIGLLHPVVVDGEALLIAGGRRLEAVKVLGWKEVPVTVATNLGDVAKALQAERDENTCRKDPTPSEAVELAKALEPFEKKAASERKNASNGERVTITSSEKGAASNKIAAAVGLSRPTLARATAVVEAAEEHPEHYADLREEMDRTGKVKTAYRALVERQTEPNRPPTRLPHHRIDPEPFADDDEELPPVPDGPTPEEIVRANPFINLGKMLVQLWGGINAFHFRSTLKKLKAGSSSERRQIVKRIDGLMDELGKLKKELE